MVGCLQHLALTWCQNHGAQKDWRSFWFWGRPVSEALRSPQTSVGGHTPTKHGSDEPPRPIPRATNKSQFRYDVVCARSAEFSGNLQVNALKISEAVGRSDGRTVGRSDCRTVEMSKGRMVGGTVERTARRWVVWSLGRSVGRAVC